MRYGVGTTVETMIKNARRWAPRGLWRYAVAVGGAATAFGLRDLLHPLLDAHMPALFFTIAAVLTGFTLGIRPAVLVVLIGIPVADYYFVPPYGNFSHVDRADLILFIAFPGATLLFLLMIEWLRRTQHEAKLFTEVARCRYEMLMRAEKRRKVQQSVGLATQRVLRSLSDGDGNGHLVYIGKVANEVANEVANAVARERGDLLADVAVVTGTGQSERFVIDDGIYELVRSQARVVR